MKYLFFCLVHFTAHNVLQRQDSCSSMTVYPCCPMRGFPFLRLNNGPLYVFYIFFIHSSVFGYLGCFYDLAVIINVAMYMGGQISLLRS